MQPGYRTDENIHYRLTHGEWLRAARELKPRERDILYYLRTLDPFGDQELELTIRKIAADLSIGNRRCSPGTVSNALKSLNQKGWIDLELEVVKVRLRTHQTQQNHSELSHAACDTCGKSDLSSDHRSLGRSNSDQRNVEKRSLQRSLIAGEITDRWRDHAEIQEIQGTQEFSTEIDPLPKQTNIVLFKTVGNADVDNWSSTTGEIDSGADLSLETIEKGCRRIYDLTGVIVNASLRAVIEKIGSTEPERLSGRITAAINAYLEQRPTIRNPQAFLSAALQRGFTSNEWKNKQKPIKITEKQSKTNFPPPRTSSAADLSKYILAIRHECSRLNCTIGEALEVWGSRENSLTHLTEAELLDLYVNLRDL